MKIMAIYFTTPLISFGEIFYKKNLKVVYDLNCVFGLVACSTWMLYGKNFRNKKIVIVNFIGVLTYGLILVTIKIFRRMKIYTGELKKPAAIKKNFVVKEVKKFRHVKDSYMQIGN